MALLDTLTEFCDAVALNTGAAGTYLLGGTRTDRLDERGLAHVRSRAVGFVFQNYHLIPHLTVRENLEVRFLYGARPAADLRLKIGKALADLAIEHLAERHPRHLSGGEMQRVALARALVGGADLLLADEPTGNLDNRNSEIVFSLLAEVAQAGTAVVMVTHDLELARRCPRHLRLNNGRLCSDEG